jgi:hypothetical protein
VCYISNIIKECAGRMAIHDEKNNTKKEKPRLTSLAEIPRDQILYDDETQLLQIRLETGGLLDDLPLLFRPDGPPDGVPVLEVFQGDVGGYEAGDAGYEDELVGHRIVLCMDVV